MVPGQCGSVARNTSGRIGQSVMIHEHGIWIMELGFRAAVLAHA